MLFFWNRYELPALQNGFINPLRPRFYVRTAEEVPICVYICSYILKHTHIYVYILIHIHTYWQRRAEVSGEVSYVHQEEEEGHPVVADDNVEPRSASILDQDPYEFEQSVVLSRRIQQQELSNVFGIPSSPHNRNIRNNRNGNIPPTVINSSSRRSNDMSVQTAGANRSYLGPQGNVYIRTFIYTYIHAYPYIHTYCKSL